MRTSFARPLASLLLLLAACGDSDRDDGPGGAASTGTEATSSTGSTGSAGDPTITFSPQGCDATTCWVVPSPQGNQLVAVRAAPDGTAYGVGAHGAFVRFDGNRWTAAALPVEAFGGDRATLPHLRGVAVIDEADVWLVGDGGTVLRFDGATVRAQPPDAAPSTHYSAILATGKDDVWISDRRGRIFRGDGAAWTVAHQGSDEILGMWASDATDVWALAVKDTGAALALHFDGSAWTEEAVPVDGLLSPGAAVAISGIERGRPWIAFAQGLLRRASDGTFETIHDPSLRDAHADATDLLVTGPDQAWLATPSDSFTSATRITSGAADTPALDDGLVSYLGADAAGQPWLLGAGGNVFSPSRPETSVRTTVSADPGTLGQGRIPATPCAPSGDAIFCAQRRDDAVFLTRSTPDTAATSTVAGPFPIYPVVSSVHADAAGNVLVVRATELALIDAGGAPHALTVPDDASLSDLTQAVILDDGSIYAVRQSCSLYRSTSSSAFGQVVFDDPRFDDELRFCRLTAPPGGGVWMTGYYSTTGTDDGLHLVVIDASGATVFDALLPPYHTLDLPVTVTASGRPFVATDGGSSWQIYEGAGGALTPAAVDVTSEAPLLAARGEDLFYLDPADTPAASLRSLRGGSAERAVLPLHGPSQLAVGARRVWIQADNAILVTKPD